jgi:glucosyl-3-phosphoglycerate synthase
MIEIETTPVGNLPRPQVLMPILPGSDNHSLLRLARWLAPNLPVLLTGLVPVQAAENLSAGAKAAEDLRKLINEAVDRKQLRAKSRVRVSEQPWEDLCEVIKQEPTIHLMVLNWPTHFDHLRVTAAELLSRPPCDIAILRGPLPEKIGSILVLNRGGPHAEKALRLCLDIMQDQPVKITSMRIKRSDEGPELDEQLAGMEQILEQFPTIHQEVVVADDEYVAALELSNQYDLTVLGTIASPTEMTSSLGKMTDLLISQSNSPVVAIKPRFVPPSAAGSEFRTKAISILVDRWFAENTFSATEFEDLNHLLTLKEERGKTISLALPALNEEKTVGNVISMVKKALMEDVPLLDEIVLIDSNSADRTREIAEDLGVPVYIHQQILPQYGARRGKGEALWKSLYVTSGDIILWVDTDIVNFHPRFVYGLIGPLLQSPRWKFVKGFYRRPLRGEDGQLHPGRGGRVTELTARPLINLFYPQLSGIIQPLAGEYGGRRELLEQVQFTSGYGVEMSLLIDVLEQFGLDSIAQVDLEERIHTNQPLDKLSKMSFAIIQTVIHKLEKRFGTELLKNINLTMKTMHYEPDYFYLEVDEIAELFRPIMLDIPEYRQKRGLENQVDA